MKKLVVLTSGGDAPGMNAALRAVVRTGIAKNFKVFACPRGFQGLVDQTLRPMALESVANIIQRGGTSIQTDRSQAFYEKKTRDAVRQFLAKEKIDNLVVIGGDGSFRGAALLHAEGGPKVIGIPTTIDNDIPDTEYTIGYDTALNTALEAIDRLCDTAASHERSILVEVMGRNAGFLALDVGIAGGAEYILCPENEIPLTTLAAEMNKPHRHKLSSVIIVAEAGTPERSVKIAAELEQLVPNHEFRVCILGHIQRGGSPTAYDRKIASIMGFEAVLALDAGLTNQFVAMQNNQLLLAPFPGEEAGGRRLQSDALLKMNRLLAQ